LTPDEAVRISGISSRAIYRLIEEGRIHLTETPDGVALVCPATLLKQIWKQDG
jgi:predicted site-specific integrase-resolvase